MKHPLRERLTRANGLFVDLVGHVPEEALASHLGELRSNTIGEQLWCVVGARNSYLNAARVGSWQGFSCPLTKAQITRKDVAAALTSVFDDLEAFLASAPELTEAQEDYLWDLLEHEVQHHGQVIRYLYGLGLGVPESWKRRYNLA